VKSKETLDNELATNRLSEAGEWIFGFVSFGFL
jgi:hypothetical protein